MKKLMVIGASVLQVPAIKRAKELGFEVAVADYDKNAAGIQFADKFYNVSTIDAEGVTEAARDFGADGIMTLASDMPMRSVARAGKELGLAAVSEETAVNATDKGEMIKCFKKHNVPSPWYYIASTKEDFEAILEKVEYPCIMKPLDNSGSRGIILAHSEKELVMKLVLKGHKKEYAVNAVSLLKEYNYVNDERTAEIYAKDLFERKGMSVNGIINELCRKGISREIACNAVEKLDNDPILRIIDLLNRKYSRFLSDEKGIRKTVSALQRLGYSWSDIRTALRQYEIETEDD